ncbi:hypothetical protein AAWM_06288 [Aspergillus awamori]|uniref:Uncharacterized protein n=1 Tax=Aspergillus awamori TaxID=105351 RepID=A0A401KVS8_ASPAW|nr:hypothetical protein AAWM_06288 [Aspergillus awamori]GKZ58675.1 hypothetical protein AnigIFM49718_004503 [Aspergillus niger]
MEEERRGILRPTRHAATARAGKLGQVLGVQPDDEKCEREKTLVDDSWLVDEEETKGHEEGRLGELGCSSKQDERQRWTGKKQQQQQQQNKKLVGRGVQRTAERENQEALLKLDRHT